MQRLKTRRSSVNLCIRQDEILRFVRYGAVPSLSEGLLYRPDDRLISINGIRRFECLSETNLEGFQIIDSSSKQPLFFGSNQSPGSLLDRLAWLKWRFFPPDNSEEVILKLSRWWRDPLLAIGGEISSLQLSKRPGVVTLKSSTIQAHVALSDRTEAFEFTISPSDKLLLAICILRVML